MIDLAPSIAITVTCLTASVILAGSMSGIVALSAVQLWARERIQSQVISEFFPGRPYALLHINPRILDRLYYRQLCGQFLAAINAEAASPEHGRPVTEFVLQSGEYYGGYERGREHMDGLHYAARRLDVLQAYLGDAVSRWVMANLTRVWFVLYFIIGITTRNLFAWDAVLSGWGASWARAIVYVLIVGIMTLILAMLLALCSAACALVIFNWLDRAIAEK